MNKNRPYLLTGVCLYLLIWGCYLLFTSFSNLKDPTYLAAMDKIGLPFAFQAAMIYINAGVYIVCGMYMMQEFNWARWVYLGWGFVNIDYNLYVQPDWHNNVLLIGVYLITAMILLMPSGNKYFSSVIDYDDLDY
jgi:hypothetical protein